MSALNGLPRSAPKSRTERKLAAMLSAGLAMAFLSGCGTIPETATRGPSKELSLKARCAGWTDLDYSAEHDTPKTINGILKHNETGKNKGCWK